MGHSRAKLTPKGRKLLVAAGHDVTLEVIPNTYHRALANPQVVGEAIVSFLVINSLIPKMS